MNIKLCSVKDYILIDDLRVHPDNPRTIKEERMYDLCRSIVDKGFYEPILVWKKGNYVLSGNHRLKAVRLLQEDGYTFGEKSTKDKLPVVYVDEGDNRATQILFETNNSYAEWIDEKVREALRHVEDIRATGFTDDELKNLLEGALDDATRIAPVTDEEYEGEDAIPTEETDEFKGHLQIAYNRLLDDWKKSIAIMNEHSDYLFQTISTGKFLVDFLRFKYLHKSFPRLSSLAYNKHQFYVAGASGSLMDFLNSDIPFDSLHYCMKSSGNLGTFLTMLPSNDCRLAPDFPAELAKSLIDEFCPVGGKVLDPCHGWGGRLVGFHASHASKYVGIDCSPQTSEAVNRMAKDLSVFAPEKSVRLHCKKFEDFKPKIKRRFDFALTSPPYFDVEKYEGEEQSRIVYSKYDDWRDGFYTTLIKSVYALLVDGGVFALQVGSQTYPLANDAVSISEATGFSLRDVRTTSIMPAKKDKKRESDWSGEVVIILEKV